MLSLCLLSLVASTLPSPSSSQAYPGCDLPAYYSSLIPSGNDLTAATRDEMHDLLVSTHRNVLPYTDGTDARDDVWDALADVDGDGGGSVRLVYGDRAVPASPRDAGTCECECHPSIMRVSLGLHTTALTSSFAH